MPNKEHREHGGSIRMGLLLATLLPLWVLWAYSYASLKGLQVETDRLPRFFGIHLYKQQVLRQLELFAGVVDQLDRVKSEAFTDALNEEFDLNEIGMLARLSGLDEALLLVRSKGLEILYPSSPGEKLAPVMGDSGDRRALLRTLQHIAENRAREGYFSIAPKDDSLGQGVSRWYLAVAYAGKDLLCVFMIPEETVSGAGATLQSAQEALFEDRLSRFLSCTLPVMVLSSILIGGLCLRRKPSAGEGSEESRHDG